MKINERIKARRKELKLTQAAVATYVKVSRVSVTQWELGDTSPKGENLFRLAEILKCSSEWILFGRGNPDLRIINTLKKRQQEMFNSMVPLISYVQAGDWCNPTTYQSSEDEFTRWYPCPEKHSQKTFALEVRGDSMAPEFVHGEIIYIDPEVEPVNGSCVVVQQNGSTDATFKQLIVDGDNKYLKALNPDWPNPIIQMLPDAVVCGVVIFSCRKRN